MNQSDFTILRPAVEKEILHQDILRTLNKAGFLKKLTFMGGTCLRTCYEFARLSEDLDFSGGFDFKKDELLGIGSILQKAIWEKYNLNVKIYDPIKEAGNTHTWKIKIITSPERPDLPQQQINIDVCMLPSYEPQPVMLKNYYGLEFGTSGLIIMAESLVEIFADKIIALALRPNRVKNRDLWDIYQLKTRNISLSIKLVKQKLNDRRIEFDYFHKLYSQRLSDLKLRHQEFLNEMNRFLIPAVFSEEWTDKHWWENYLALLKNLENL